MSSLVFSFHSYQTLTRTGEMLQSWCCWFTKYTTAWQQCNWLLHKSPLPCMYMGVPCICSWLVGKASAPNLHSVVYAVPPSTVSYKCIWRGDWTLFFMCTDWEWISEYLTSTVNIYYASFCIHMKKKKNVPASNRCFLSLDLECLIILVSLVW